MFSRKDEEGLRKRNAVEEVMWNETGCNDEFEILLVDEITIEYLYQEVGNRNSSAHIRTYIVTGRTRTWL